VTPELENRADSTLVPVGTVTMLLTDVEGSTRLWEEHADAMRVAIRRHHELAYEQIESHGGYRPPDQGEGDSVFAVFADAPSALACALDLQRALAAEPWPEAAELRVRMALHTGGLELRDGRNYSGVALSRCARLRAIAHGGQTVVSEATRVLVGDDLPPDAGLKDLGSHRLKDLAAPEQVFQLTHAELPAEFPPLRSLDARPHNLPVQLTRFVGRERELAELGELLGKTRLLTLTGTGGCGKTRLALQLAAQLVDRFPDGVWLAELAGVSDPALVPRVLASAMVVREQHGRSITNTLVDQLGLQSTLLLLDNCEHLVDACAELAERVLVSCPDVAVVATSREPLAVPGEMLWRVPSLSLPEPGAAVGVESLSASESAQLFLDRAAAAEPSFALTEDNAASVAAVCRRLEGIPLAVELAAAGLRAFSLEDVERRLDTQFRPLGAPSRMTLARQQTLRATIDWSHDLLNERERLLFRRLSVFAGGFASTAAEDVCVGEGIERDDVLDLLGQVVLKSLVQRDTQAGRYRLLGVIREYAFEKLREAGEEDGLRRRHLDWAIGLAERVEPELHGPDQQAWLERLHADLDNFRAAFGWSVERESAAPALRLGSALLEFWIVRADWTEGREWIENALVLASDVSPAIRMKALRAAGELADVLSDFPSATRHYEESLEIARGIDDQRGIAEALLGLANEAERVGKYAEARPLIEESVTIFRALGDEPSLARSLGGLAWLENDFRRSRTLWQETLALRRRLGNRESVGWALIQVGFCAWHEGDYPSARKAYEEALAIARDLGYKRMLARTLIQLGEVALAENDLGDARAQYEESLPIWREIGHRTGLIDALRDLGDLARLEGDGTAAAALLEESLSVSREIGARDKEALALDSLGALARTEGELEDAERLHGEALALWREVGDTAGTALSLHRAGLVAAARERFADAARLLGEAESLREQAGAALPPHERAEEERAVDAARAALGDGAFAAAREAGRGLVSAEA
jgi:predicted ATPase/class 3 adenylate cyclase